MFTTTQILNEDCHPQPRLSALLGCGENLMPLSWHMPVSKAPFRYAVAIRPENRSYDLVHTLGEFSINFLDYAYREAMQKAGSVHGGDKFAVTGLHPKEAIDIKSKLVEESYMIYECKVVEILNFGDHDIFVADVLRIHNSDEKGSEPTLFLGRGYYDTTTQNPQRIERV